LTIVLCAVATAALFVAGVYAPERIKLVFLYGVILAGVSGGVWGRVAFGNGVPVRSPVFSLLVAASVGASHFLALQVAHQRIAARMAASERNVAASMLASIELPDSSPDDASSRAALDEFREGQKRARERLSQSPAERYPMSRFLRWRISSVSNGTEPWPVVWYAAEWLSSVALAVVVARYSGSTTTAVQKPPRAQKR
jgi:hypothetical protein